jgi:hypothetical protein
MHHTFNIPENCEHDADAAGWNFFGAADTS